MIDPHVHLRDWNQRDEETLSHGMSVAKRAGFNVLFDMPNCDPPLTDEPTVLRRIEDARKAAANVQYRVFLGLTAEPSQISLMCSLARRLGSLVAGLKMFCSQSTGNMGIVEAHQQELVYRTLSDCGYEGVLALHCEKQSEFVPDKNHSLARPGIGEVKSVSDQIHFSQSSGFKGHIHICHISTQGALSQVCEARDKGLRISCGATGHHSLYNMNNVPYYKMNPPLRSESDRKAIVEALMDGRIDWVESDHAPHSNQRISNGASGIPGFSNSLRLFGFLKPYVSKQRLRQLFETSASHVFSISPADDEFDRIYQEKNLEQLIDEIDKEYPFKS